MPLSCSVAGIVLGVATLVAIVGWARDPGARTCDTRIELTRPRDGDPFSEQHRQYFHADADVRASLQDAGFEVTTVSREYTHEPADASTLRATWTFFSDLN